jgi:hypothetical protein
MNNDFIEDIRGLSETTELLVNIFAKEKHEDVPLPEDESHLPEAIAIDTDISIDKINIIKESARFETVAAVDGGSALLISSGGLQVGVCKGASAIYTGFSRTELKMTPEWMLASGEGIDNGFLDSFLTEHGFSLESYPEWNSRIDFARELLEFVLMKRNAGGDSINVVLMDGALNPALSSYSSEYNDFLRELYVKGVIVIGVSKSSTLRWSGNYPLISRFAEIIKELPCGNTCFKRISGLKSGYKPAPEIPDIYLAGLYAGLGPVLRLDIPSVYRSSAESIIAGLAAISVDPEFPGYPYPLVEAHRHARITPSRKKHLSEIIRRMVTGRGIEPQVYEAAFGDYHNRLNADIEK